MYGKVFARLFDGTLHGKFEAAATFMAMIAIADQDGVVDLTLTALTSRTGWPADVIEKGIRELEADDPYSRTPDEDGRRIMRLRDNTEWGWRIVNYGKYRGIRNEVARREYMREYMRNRRKQNVSSVNGCKPKLAQAEAEVIKDTTTKREPKRRASLPDDFTLTPERRQSALKRYADADVDSMFEQFRAHHVAHGSVMKSWDAAWTTWLGNAAKFGYPKVSRDVWE